MGNNRKYAQFGHNFGMKFTPRYANKYVMSHLFSRRSLLKQHFEAII